MATIEVEEYGAPRSRNGSRLPLGRLPANAVRQIASGGAGNERLAGETTLIAVTADADCRIRVGKTGAATASDPLLKAGVLRWFEVPASATIRFD
ncbi:hypothetical protein [Sphingomonas sp. KC8]|uniref:hypothetical protein n=1 Tax=Sphingomonas sp. KC8 TaxID=1030157 RepID=UPI000248A426|nr:hypothetical protein [Sphingomonas sp. KC8]ARS27629.1 hypothetical protein KC8_10025 [Sphingomonas sp. KC8]